MNPTRVGRMSVAAAVVVCLAACGSDYPLGEAQESAAKANTSDLSGNLTGVGSSAQAPAMDAWQSGFGVLHSKAQVQYAPAGSGAGRTTFLAGGSDFAGSDAYLHGDEPQQAMSVCGTGGAIDIPVYISPISIAFNLPGITALNLDAATIAAIFRGDITTWGDQAIAALNKDTKLPDMPITAVHRADDSGTTENFTDYLHAAAPHVWTDDPDGGWPSGLDGENAQANSGVVSTVTRTVGAITYADDSVVGESLGKARLKVGSRYVPVSAQAASIAAAESRRVPGRSEHDMALELNRTTTAEGAYPLILVSYHIYCTTYPDPQTLDLVKAFGLYVVSPEGQRTATDSAGSAPMPETLAAEARSAIESITLR
jgi:phosphate transport system substrate-binding protein